ncbi:MAG: acetate--CoA ligase [Minwuiales bacterium]|nr:acetate--CoA ligase [Minwuiales bacterium]
MSWDTIKKAADADAVEPNLKRYDDARAKFTWDAARAELDGLPGGKGLNIAHEAVDRHVLAGRGERTALRWVARDGRAHDLSYADLAEHSSRFANVLSGLGIAKGDVLSCLMPRVPELYAAALGTWKAGAVFSPLFPAFGPEPVQSRMEIGKTRVLVTTATLYRRKVASVRDRLPDLRHVLLLREDSEAELPDGTVDLRAAMGQADPAFVIPPTDAEDLAILHFTSGTTGKPKGAMHVHAAVVAHHATGRFALDLHDDDIYWCTADPGWVTGTSYGIIAPLVCGVTMISDSEEFDAERWYRILQDNGVTVWYTAPTAVRMLMKRGADLAREYDLSALRFAASVGEPLNPEGVVWGVEAFGRPFHDNWWQTETGGIMIGNFAAMDVKPGSMGRPLPGIEAAVVRRENGSITVIDRPDEDGELALRPGWPSMFRGYLGQPERYENAFAGGWYLTGDLARRDSDGYFWFVGRADDVIKSAGHLIGPFEVESALMEHPAVSEAGVIGLPDAVAGEVVKAHVALKPGFEAGEPLRRELLRHTRKRLGPAVAPRAIDFQKSLPKTRSGKIMRRLLKARELGLPEGDLSTLENGQ